MDTIMVFNVDEISNQQIDHSIIFATYLGKKIFVRKIGSKTWEIPGGRKEKEESIINCANRELFEETGATRYSILPIMVYRNEKTNRVGLVCLSIISEICHIPEGSEIEEIKITNDIPKNLSYPVLYEKLFPYVEDIMEKIIKQGVGFSDVRQ
jgi:8-oxo-dGTP diphosphatase